MISVRAEETMAAYTSSATAVLPAGAAEELALFR
jgi:hypothetical protein